MHGDVVVDVAVQSVERVAELECGLGLVGGGERDEEAVSSAHTTDARGRLRSPASCPDQPAWDSPQRTSDRTAYRAPITHPVAAATNLAARTEIRPGADTGLGKHPTLVTQPTLEGGEQHARLNPSRFLAAPLSGSPGRRQGRSSTGRSTLTPPDRPRPGHGHEAAAKQMTPTRHDTHPPSGGH